MARSIPKKTTTKSEIYRRVTVADLAICAIAFLAIVFVVISALPMKFGLVLVVAAIAITLVARVDALPIYIYMLHTLRHFVLPHRFARDVSDALLIDREESKQKAFGELFTDEELRNQELNRLLEDPNIADEVKEKIRTHREIERSKTKQNTESDDKMRCRSMEQLCAYTEIEDGVIGYANQYFATVLEVPELESPMIPDMLTAMQKVLRGADFCMNIVKLERLATTEDVLVPCYFLVIFDKNRVSAVQRAESASLILRDDAGINASILNSDEIAVFLKYTNFTVFDASQSERISERDLAAWSMPNVVKIKPNTVEVNQIVTHNFCAVTYPELVENDWLARLFSVPSTKCVLKCRLMDRQKAIDEMKETPLSSEQMEVLTKLESGREDILEVSLYITAYDRVLTESNEKIKDKPPTCLPKITNFKEKIRKLFYDSGIVLNRMPFDQLHAFLGAQISANNPCDTWLMPSETLAASGLWLHDECSEFATETAENVPATELIVTGNLTIEGFDDETEAEEQTDTRPQLPDLISETPEESASANAEETV